MSPDASPARSPRPLRPQYRSPPAPLIVASFPRLSCHPRPHFLSRCLHLLCPPLGSITAAWWPGGSLWVTGCPDDDDDDEFLFVFPGPWWLTMFPVIRTQQVCRSSGRAPRAQAGLARWGGAQWAGSGEGQGEDQ